MKSATLVVVVLLGIGVWVLRATTMTVHQPVPPDSTLEVVFNADTRQDTDPLVDLSRAHADLCVAESVPGRTITTFEQTAMRAGLNIGEFRMVLQPGADPPDREQLHGCLEDVRVRHLRLEVTSMVQRSDEGRIQEET